MSIKSQNKATHQQADGAVFLPYEKVFVAKVADMDASNNVSFPIDAEQFVLDIIARCVTSISGGTPAVLVGDGTDPDGYVVAGDALETAGAVVKVSKGSAAFAHGKYYSSSDRLIVNFNSGATAGEIELRVLFSGKES